MELRFEVLLPRLKGVGFSTQSREKGFSSIFNRLARMALTSFIIFK